MTATNKTEDAAHFDQAAESWDQPHRVKQARQFLVALARVGMPREGQRLMDYGCGTGLLSIPLARTAEYVYALDSSQGMLDVLGRKMVQAGVNNIGLHCVDLSREPFCAEQPLDGIVTAMALHHVADISLLFSNFYDVLCAGGRLVLFDLEKEDGSFHRSHGGEAVPHHGFSRDELGELLGDAGFAVRSMERVLSIRKDVGGVDRDYPVFMLVAER